MQENMRYHCLQVDNHEPESSVCGTNQLSDDPNQNILKLENYQ